MSKSGRARALPWAFAVVALLVILAARNVLEGTAANRRSDELRARGDLDGAIALAMAATRAYVPWAPHVGAGYDRLRDIALGAELAGDSETALLAWEAIRAGARATRTLYTPFADRLAEADDRIAVLLATRSLPGIDREKPRDLVVREHRALLAEASAARPFAIVAMYVGLAFFLFGAHRSVGGIDAQRVFAPARVLGSPRAEHVAAGVVLAMMGMGALAWALLRA